MIGIGEDCGEMVFVCQSQNRALLSLEDFSSGRYISVPLARLKSPIINLRLLVSLIQGKVFSPENVSWCQSQSQS